MSYHIKWLRQAAKEIREKNYAGWGNTCEFAADAFEQLQAENAAQAERIKELEEAMSIHTAQPRIVTLSYQGREWELPVVNAGELWMNGMGFTAIAKKEIDGQAWLAALREIANGEGGQ